MDKLIPLLGPSIPALGMRSAQDPSTLTPGLWSRLENLRTENGTLKVRDGATTVVTSPPATLDGLRGLYSATFNGVAYLFLAFRHNATTTKVYYLNGASLTEIAGVGAFFTVDGEIGFAVVHQEGLEGSVNVAGDVLVMGNGSVIVTAATTSTLFDTVASVVAPDVPTSATQTAIPYGYQLVAPDTLVDASRAYNSAPTEFATTAGASTTGPILAVDATVTVDETSAIVFDVSVLYDGTFPQGLTLQKEIVFGSYFSEQGDSLWEYVKKVEALVRPVSTATVAISGTSAAAGVITVTTAGAHGYSTGDYVYIAGVTGFAMSTGVFRITVTGGTTFELDGTNTTGTGTGGTSRVLEWITIWDASVSDGSFALFEMEATNGSGAVASMAVFQTYPYEGREGWCGVRFTSNGNQPAADVTNQFLTVATSGQIDGRSLFAVGYYKRNAFTEGVAKEATRSTASLMSFGGALVGARFTWEPGSNWRTAYRIDFPGSQASTGAPTYALLYRSDPYLAQDGTVLYDRFYFDESLALPATEPAGGNTIYSTSETLTVTRTARDVGSLPIPNGTLFAVANDRLFVSGLGTSKANELWVSGDRNPFFFRQVPAIDENGNQDPTSPTYRTFAGESVTALLKMHGDLYGVDTLLLWTDRGLYRLGGFDSRQITQAARLGDKGTKRRQTVAPYDGTVWFLDTEKQARMSSGGLASNAMTRDRVDDFLAAGTLTNAYAMAGYSGYRLFFQEAGASDIRVCLVWTEDTKEWVLDRYPFAIAGVCIHESGTDRIMYAVGATGLVWRLETYGQTTDAGTAIPIRLDGPEVSEGWAAFVSGSIGVITDGAVNTTLTTTRTNPYDGSTTTGTINLLTAALTTSSAWRWDTDGSGGIPGTPVGFSTIPKITGDMLGGKRIRAVVMKVEPRASGADRA